MKIVPKPPEVLKAQVAAFASERIDYYIDQEYMLGNVNQIATDKPETITRVVGNGEYAHSEQLPEGSEREVATAGDLVEYLRA